MRPLVEVNILILLLIKLKWKMQLGIHSHYWDSSHLLPQLNLSTPAAWPPGLLENVPTGLSLELVPSFPSLPNQLIYLVFGEEWSAVERQPGEVLWYRFFPERI